LRGFTEGVMLVGEHTGKPVQLAKPLIRDELIAVSILNEKNTYEKFCEVVYPLFFRPD
jgi:hypothetical protein